MRMRHGLFAGLAAALTLAFAQIAAAQGCPRATNMGWGAIEWNAGESLGTGALANDQLRRALDVQTFLEPYAATGLDRAAKWLQNGQFRAPALCTDVPFMLDFRRDGTDTAYYFSTLGQIALRGFRTGLEQDFLGLLPTEEGEGVAMGDFLDVVFAHELFHAVQEATVPIEQVVDQGGEWVVEGTANAVGVGYAHSRGEPGQALHLTAWRPNYDLPLHQPEADARSHHRLVQQAAAPLFDFDSARPDQGRATLAPYTRGHFFHHMGLDLGSKDGSGWLAKDYTPEVADGVGGLRWLDGVLARHGQGGLAQYYPSFIARHAADLNAYSTEALAEAGWAVALRPGEILKTRRAVRPVAAQPVSVEVSLEAPQDLFWVEHRLEAPQIDTLDMVVDAAVLPKGRAYGVLMVPGSAQWLTRVTNVRPRAPWTTAEAVFDLTLSATQVRVSTGCAAGGNRLELTSNGGPELDAALANAVAAGEMRWRVDGGAQIGPLTVLAPSQVGNHKLFLEVAAQNGWRSYPLGEIEVRARGCMIRVEVGETAASITYVPGDTPAEDFSEIASPEGGGLYLREGEVQMFTPNEGWVAMPPDMRAALTEGVTLNPLDLLGLDAPEIAAAHASLHPALMISETLSRAPLESAQRTLSTSVLLNRASGGRYGTGAAGPADGALQEQERVTCPKTPHQSCTRSALELGGIAVGEVIHDALGRPVQLRMRTEGGAFSDQIFTFSYGLFDVTRPPGW